MSLSGYVCLIFIAVQTLLITIEKPKKYSSDQLLSLCASTTLLNHDQQLRTTQLGLRRRSCWAGNHMIHLRQAARSVTSSTCSESTPEEIPIINNHRSLFTNNDQLYSSHRGERCQTESTVCLCCSKMISRRRHRMLLTRQSVLRAILLCHRVAHQAAAGMPSACTGQSTVGLPLQGINKFMPSLYVLNDTALSKPHAIKNLSADLSYNINMAVISQMHYKAKHTESTSHSENDS